MLKQVAALAAAVALAGCHVTTPGGISTLTQGGMLRVEPHPTRPDAVVVHLSSHDWAAALDDADIQRRMVDTMLTAQCGEPAIEDRRVMQGVRTAIGVQHRQYVLTVRCPNGATTPADR